MFEYITLLEVGTLPRTREHRRPRMIFKSCSVKTLVSLVDLYAIDCAKLKSIRDLEGVEYSTLLRLLSGVSQIAVGVREATNNQSAIGRPIAAIHHT